LPDETVVNDFKLMELSELFQQYDNDKTELERQLYLKASEFLSDGRVEEAWKTLLAYNN